MTAPARRGAPGQHPSIKPFPAARAGAGSRKSIDLIKPRAIHPRSQRQLLVTQGQAPEPAGSWQPGRGCGTSRAVLLPWLSTSRFQLAPSINPTHCSPSIPPLRQAEAQWGDSEAEICPQDPIAQVPLSFPPLPARAAPGEPAGRGCRSSPALTCVQGDVGGVDHLKLQAGEENSPLGKNERRWGMSGREAGVGMQLPNPGSPGWVLPVRSSQELPCRRGAREREAILPRFLQGLGPAGIPAGSERERLLWVGYRLMLLPSGTVTSPVAKGLLPSLQCFIKESLP